MTERGTAAANDLTQTAQALQQIARQLSEIAKTLSSQGVAPAQAKGLEESALALEEATRNITRGLEENARDAERRNWLRQAILRELLRGGPALPMELAASVFAFVEDIQPVLAELERHGLVQIRRVAGADVIELTAQGRHEAGQLRTL